MGDPDDPLVGDLNHGEADNLIADLKALLEHLTDGVLRVIFAVAVHHCVVKVGVEGLTDLTENLHAQTIQNLNKLCHGHFHTLFIGGILGGLVQGPLQIVVDGKKLCHGIGLAVAVGGFLLLQGALAEIVIFRSQTQVCVMLSILFFLEGIHFGNLGSFLRRNLGDLLFGFRDFFLICHVYSSWPFSLFSGSWGCSGLVKTLLRLSAK